MMNRFEPPPPVPSSPASGCTVCLCNRWRHESQCISTNWIPFIFHCAQCKTLPLWRNIPNKINWKSDLASNELQRKTKATYFDAVDLGAAARSAPGGAPVLVLHPYQHLHVWEPPSARGHGPGFCPRVQATMAWAKPDPKYFVFCLICRNHHCALISSSSFSSSFPSSSSSSHPRLTGFPPPHLPQTNSAERTDCTSTTQQERDLLSASLPRLFWPAKVLFGAVRSLVPTPLLFLDHSVPRQATLVLLASQVEGAKQWGGAGVGGGRRRRRERDESCY